MTARSGFKPVSLGGTRLVFPDLLTALTLIAGVVALFSTLSGELISAIVLVGAALCFNYFDGLIARSYNSVHDFGRELDSVANLVTFGIVPPVISLARFPGDEILLWAGALYALAAAFTIVRLNLQRRRKRVFIGLPVPFAAVLLLVLFFAPISSLFCQIVMLVLSVLMVSTFTWRGTRQ